MMAEVAEAWAVEVREDDGTWLPVEIFIDKAEAEDERLGWIKASPTPAKHWRVMRYAPNPEAKS